MKRLFISCMWLAVGGLFVLSAQAQIISAEGALEKKEYDRALEHIEESLSRKPDNEKAHAFKGRIHMEKAFATEDPEAHAEEIRLMLESFKHAVSLKEKVSKQVDPFMSYAYLTEFQRGIEAYQAGSSDREAFNAAATYFGLASEIMPDSTGTYVNQAFSLLNAGRDVEAAAPLEKAIALGDAAPDSYRYLATIYMANDRVADAVPLLEKATAMYPDDKELQGELLNAYALTGQGDKAMASYAKAVEEDPDNAILHYNYGVMLLQDEQYDPAIERFQAALALDPEYANAHYNLGAAYVNQAIEVNKKINEIDDDLRANKASLSAEEIEEREAKMLEMADARRALFAQAVEPLSSAKTLLEAAGDDVSDVCVSLYQAYAQTNQIEEAETVASCAGYAEEN